MLWKKCGREEGNRMNKKIRDIILNIIQLPIIGLFYLVIKICDIYYYLKIKNL
jgi:ABC-type uncharacterized transport system involved in gliding motility auxiliary subunit